jgi:hypothetical protein
MKPYRLKIKILITISGFISILVLSAVLLMGHKVDNEKLFEILLHYGLIILPITLLWWLMEKIGWHWRWVQKIRSSLNFPPDFRGRWEGTLNREGEDNPHRFVLEIRQTLSKIWINTYSSRGTSISYIVEIATDDSEENFTLCSFWQSDSAEISHRNIPKSIFYGHSALQLFENETPKKLCGTYFTNREPQTKGRIEVDWISFELKNKFVK